MSILIIPAIDLRAGRCVRLKQGSRDSTTTYDGAPVEIAQSYQDSGAQMIHVIDLDGAFSEPNSQNRQVLQSIVSRLRVPLQFGGGLRTPDDVAQVLEMGVSRVVLGTLAVESPNVLAKFVARFGACICVGIDARNNRVMTRGWEKRETVTAVELAQRVASLGVERIVYTDVARDGMLTGVNLKRTCEIARQSGVKVTASGGVSSLTDIRSLERVSETGVDSVIIGKALYENRFTLAEAINAGRTGS